MKIAVLGSTGMLGHEVARVFSSNFEDILCINRDIVDAENCRINELKGLFSKFDWVINCIGIIKPYIHKNNILEVKRAITVNAFFPHILAQATKDTNTKVIQIATDCVYSGKIGKYDEGKEHDAIDIYGKTKSLGEVQQKGFINLRCSIIGKEIKGKLSLLEWFLNQPTNAVVNGYGNHMWNGITTTAFAKICLGIIKNDVSNFTMQHVVPTDILSKAEMLNIFRDSFKRKDISIKPVNALTSIDRTLSTLNEDRNKDLWEMAGYTRIPTIEEMIGEIAGHDK